MVHLRTRRWKIVLAALVVLAIGYTFALAKYGSPAGCYHSLRYHTATAVLNEMANGAPVPSWLFSWSVETAMDESRRERARMLDELLREYEDKASRANPK